MTERLTDAELAELRELAEKATPGPWVYSPERDTHDSPIHQDIPVGKYGYYGYDDGGVVGSSEWIWLKDDDAAFIARSREAVPRLLDEVERLRDALRTDVLEGVAVKGEPLRRLAEYEEIADGVTEEMLESTSDAARFFADTEDVADDLRNADAVLRRLHERRKGSET